MRRIPIDTSRYEQFLADKGLAKSTIRMRASALRSLLSRGEMPPDFDSIPPHLRANYKRAWDNACELDPSLPRVDHVMCSDKRTQLHESFSDEDFHRLLEAVSTSANPHEQIIYALCVTGLRIGDVLRLSSTSLDKLSIHNRTLWLVQKGGGRRAYPLDESQLAPFLWLRAAVEIRHVVNVASLVSRDGNWQPNSTAYQRVSERMRELGQELGLSGRVYLHRIRRTTARLVYDASKDIRLVQSLLGHESPTTSFGYINESQGKEASALLGAILRGKKK